VPGELLAVERVREPVAANFSRLVFDERLEPLWYELGWVNGSGVRIITGCVAHPTAGAMGYHYINAELMDDLVADPLEPEALVYESAPDGGLKLVAVEWIVRGPQSNPPGVPAGTPGAQGARDGHAHPRSASGAGFLPHARLDLEAQPRGDVRGLEPGGHLSVGDQRGLRCLRRQKRCCPEATPAALPRGPSLMTVKEGTEGGSGPPSVGEVVVRSYLVEVYLPRSRADEARASGRRARAAAEEVCSEGVGIRYVRTTFLPDDETCFHLFEASARAAVEEVSRRAALGRARIVAAIEAWEPARRREP
jgi:hypothetical protein